MSIDEIRKSLPELPEGMRWHVEFNTNTTIVTINLLRGPTLMYSDYVNVGLCTGSVGDAELIRAARGVLDNIRIRGIIL